MAAATCVIIMLLYLVPSGVFAKSCPQNGKCHLDYSTAEVDKKYTDICAQFSATKFLRWGCQLVNEDRAMNQAYARTGKFNQRRSNCNCKKAAETLYLVDAHGFYTKKSLQDWNSIIEWKYEMPVVLFNDPGLCMADKDARIVRDKLENGVVDPVNKQAQMIVRKGDKIHNYVYSGDAGFQDTSGIYQINLFRGHRRSGAGGKSEVQEQLLYDVVQGDKKAQFFKLTDLAQVLTQLGGDASTPIYWLCCSSELKRPLSLYGDIRKNIPQSAIVTLDGILQRRLAKRTQCKQETTKVSEDVKSLQKRLNLKDVKFVFKAGLKASPKASAAFIKREVPKCERLHKYKNAQRQMQEAAPVDIEHGHAHISSQWCWMKKNFQKLKQCLDEVVNQLSWKFHARIQTAMVAADNMYDAEFDDDEFDDDDMDMDMDVDLIREEAHSLAIRLQKKLWNETKRKRNSVIQDNEY